MKKITFILFALIAGTTFAQSSDSAEASTFAEIVKPLSITKNQDLSFGRINGKAIGGDVVVTTAGVRSAGDTDLLAPSGTVSNAQFTITGTHAYTVTITATALSSTDETNTTAVDMPLVVNNDLNANNTFTTTGDKTLKIGGTLSVNNDQEVGSYAGTITVGVVYN